MNLAISGGATKLIGGNVEGSNMMSETLAQYSAYMTMEHKYGKDYMHKVLTHFLDRYLRGRAGEIRHEPPLALVQREPYVWYEKGGQIMYTLADYIGEDKVDLALHNFLMQYRYANANNQVDAVDNTRGAAKPKISPIPTPACSSTLFAPRHRPTISTSSTTASIASSFTTTRPSPPHRKRPPDGKYKVTLNVQARKFQADGNGVESPMPLADYIDIGVFTGKKGRREAALHEA